MAKKTSKPKAPDSAALDAMPANDGERLSALVAYLVTVVGILAHINDALAGGRKRAAFVKRFEIEPERGLKNLTDDLTRRLIQVRAQRALAELEAPDDAGDGT